jgi:hypothetical protein
MGRAGMTWKDVPPHKKTLPLTIAPFVLTQALPSPFYHDRSLLGFKILSNMFSSFGVHAFLNKVRRM